MFVLLLHGRRANTHLQDTKEHFKNIQIEKEGMERRYYNKIDIDDCTPFPQHKKFYNIAKSKKLHNKNNNKITIIKLIIK